MRDLYHHHHHLVSSSRELSLSLSYIVYMATSRVYPVRWLASNTRGTALSTGQSYPPTRNAMQCTMGRHRFSFYLFFVFHHCKSFTVALNVRRHHIVSHCPIRRFSFLYLSLYRFGCRCCLSNRERDLLCSIYSRVCLDRSSRRSFHLQAETIIPDNKAHVCKEKDHVRSIFIGAILVMMESFDHFC
jgi:hypothetical protein